MKTKSLFIFYLIAFLSLLSSCVKENAISSDELVPRKDIVLTRAQMEAVRNNNRMFAYQLFKNLSAKEDGKSMLISPLSVTFAMGMVSSGAVGQTQESICAVLGFDEESQDGLNDFCHSMIKQSVEIDPSTTIGFANAAIVNKARFSLRNDYIKTVESNYDALVYYKDFAKEDIQGFVNNWCKEKTNGMIPIFLKDKVSSEDKAKFLNATYFKGIWADKFSKNESKKEKFICEDGSKITVNMMHKEFTDKSYSYVDGLCKETALEFGNGAFIMIIYLPGDGRTIDDIKDWLIDPSLYPKATSLKGKLDIKLPSFETEYEDNIIKTLSQMGMTINSKDFSKMTETDFVNLSHVYHKAKIKVDENGAEAAAITEVGARFGSGCKYEDSNFHADHPFVYTIHEVSTGAIFFIGQYTGK